MNSISIPFDSNISPTKLAQTFNYIVSLFKSDQDVEDFMMMLSIREKENETETVSIAELEKLL